MKGILARANHRIAAVNTVQEAWDFIRRAVRVDLVFLELQLPGEGGVSLIQRLKGDCLLKSLPVVVYTTTGEREMVRRVLELKVQNFLVKPYHDDVIFSEITKALVNPWRNTHFEEENSFCRLMGYTPASLHKMLDDLRAALDVARPLLAEEVKRQAVPVPGERLTGLAESAEAAGAWGVVECLNEFGAGAQLGEWPRCERALACLEFAGRLILQHLNPGLVPTDFLTERELHADEEERIRARWFNAPAEDRCPVLDLPKLQQQLDQLPGCPVIESAAASFQMAANGHPSCLTPLMDLTDKDPGLAAQMLISAAKVRHEEHDPAPIEDPRLAVSLLGELRLATLARSLVTVEERLVQAPPRFNWPRFWMFQVGVARMSRYICRYLGLHSMESRAATAGLMHDLGKLLLARLHPFGLQAVLDRAQKSGAPLREAEKFFLGCTTHELAAYFGQKQGLATPFVSAMRWVDEPAAAAADPELVAIVSFARNLCRRNLVGVSGDPARGAAPAFEETAEWAVLREVVFPSFNIRKFELQVQTDCRELKLELHGRLKNVTVA